MLSHTFIRIDGKVDATYVQQVLQKLRDIEQIAPDSIHLAISLSDDCGALLNHLVALRSITPDFPITRFLKREDMTEEQRIAHNWFLKLGKTDA